MLKKRLRVSTFRLNRFELSVLCSSFVLDICSDDWFSDSFFAPASPVLYELLRYLLVDLT